MLVYWRRINIKPIWIILGLLMKIINQIEIDDYIVIEGKEILTQLNQNGFFVGKEVYFHD